MSQEAVPQQAVPAAISQIVELRRYRLRPGARDTLIELFDASS